MQFYEDLKWQTGSLKCYACKNGMALDEQIEVNTEDGYQNICLGCYDRFMEHRYEEMGAPRYED